MVDFALRTKVEAVKAQFAQEVALVLAEQDRQIEDLIPPKGTRITAAEAKERYGISLNTPARWAEKGLVLVIQAGRPVPGGAAVYDEHDIASIVLQNDIKQGRRTDRLKNLYKY